MAQLVSVRRVKMVPALHDLLTRLCSDALSRLSRSRVVPTGRNSSQSDSNSSSGRSVCGGGSPSPRTPASSASTPPLSRARRSVFLAIDGSLFPELSYSVDAQAAAQEDTHKRRRLNDLESTLSPASPRRADGARGVVNEEDLCCACLRLLVNMSHQCARITAQMLQCGMLQACAAELGACWALRRKRFSTPRADSPTEEEVRLAGDGYYRRLILHFILFSLL